METEELSCGALTDEQLAFMLQNDHLFQVELMNYFGDDFVLANTSTVPKASGQLEYSQQFGAPPDLGVLKGLSAMGSELRKKLDGFTSKYIQNQSGTGIINRAEEEEGDHLELQSVTVITTDTDPGTYDPRPPLSPMVPDPDASDELYEDDALETVNLLGSPVHEGERRIEGQVKRSNSSTLSNMWTSFTTK